ncbi:MAG TPA: hypothetical protein VJS45_00540 [Acidimicrobiia bacterium]|nr:hypothetical protein [Acidimicrobiia bacterium]
MSAIADRTREALDRLSALFLDGGVLPIAATPEAWAQHHLFPDPGECHRRFGWVPPFLEEDRPHRPACRCGLCAAHQRPATTIQAAFCPELIAEQTADLDDVSFAGYLHAVFFTMVQHLVLLDVPAEDREVLVDDALYEACPEGLRLLSEVQFAVLDRLV